MARRRGTYKRRRTYPRRSYKRSTRYGKRRYFRRYSRVATRQNKLAFSRSQVVKMRYVQSVQLNPNADSGAYIMFRANSPFAPLGLSSAGVAYNTSHQPYGWDQWTAIYNEYVVIGSKITMTCVAPNQTSPNSGSGIVALFLSDNNSAYSVTTNDGCTNMIETGRASYKQFSPNGSGKPTVLSHKFSPKKFWNLSNLKDNVTRVGSDIGSSPTEVAYFHCYFYTNDESVTTSAGPLCWITLDYIVMFTGPTNLSSS